MTSFKQRTIPSKLRSFTSILPPTKQTQPFLFIQRLLNGDILLSLFIPFEFGIAGFYPRFLTFIMGKAIHAGPQKLPGTTYSQLDPQQRSHCLKACSTLTDAIYSGLDLSREIESIHTQNLGDTVLLWDETDLAGFAICHCGAGSEAGSDVCYVKYGVVRSGIRAGERFEQLLALCEAYGATQQTSRLIAGVNTSHDEAYARMLAQHFRTEIIGIIMQKPNEPGYNRPDVFILDDWR